MLALMVFNFFIYLNKLQIKGSNFSVMNYVYEYEFVLWIKSGGYGEVYMGKINKRLFC